MPILTNPKHEKFAQLVATGKSDVAAYQEVYGGSQINAKRNAHRVKENEGVSARITELQKKADKSTLLTMQQRRELLREIADNRAAKNADRIAAILADAKLSGELMDRRELSGQLHDSKPIIVNIPPVFAKPRVVEQRGGMEFPRNS
jgi:hypothetical protein